MADMNHLELAQPQEIDSNEVLREYGLDDAEQIATVAQNGATIVNIPNSVAAQASPSTSLETSSGLTPPAITDLETDLDALADEMLMTIGVPVPEADAANTLAADTGLPPVTVDSVTPHSIEDNETEEESTEIIGLAETEPLEHTAEETHSLDTNVPAAEENAEPESTVLSAEEAINLLPLNSKSHTIDESTARFSGAAWYNAIQKSSLILAGLGGIGSYVLFCLSRMKPRQIFIYDDDIVETVNLSGQLYSSAMVGQRKVNAMAELARSFSMYYTVQAIPQRFTETTPASDIMICGFDNMRARKDFFTAWVNHLVNHPHPEKCLFIDGRLNMEEFQVFCMKGDDTYNINRYNKECIFEDYEAESIACSMKQTTYCATMIGSVIVNLFTNFIANQLHPLIDRDLPFKTYYDASMMFFKTEV